MGLASRRHQASLDTVTPADVRSAPLAPSIAAYLDALGPLDRSDDDMRLALMIGAPFQSDYVWDPVLWQRLPPDGLHARPGHPAIAPIHDDYALWWRSVAAPRLEADERGRRWIVGLQEGMSIRSAMTQRRSGAKIWSRHLHACLEHGDEGAMRAFAEAVATTLQWSTRANFHGVVSVWTKLSRRHRNELRPVVLEVIPEPPMGWKATEAWTAWMLWRLVDADGREHLWRCWTRSSPSAHGKIPWRSFVRAGLPAARVVQWALETLADEPDADSVQVRIIAHFIESRDVDALCLLVRSLDFFAGGLEARNRLRELDPIRLRRLELEIAATLPGDERQPRLGWVHPADGDDDLWLVLANTAQGLSERLLRLVQAECASPSASTDRPCARRALTLLSASSRNDSESAEAGAMVEQDHADWLGQGGVDDRADDEGGPAARAFHQIGSSLLHTRSFRPAALADLVRLVLEGDFGHRLFIEPVQPWWWLLAVLELGPEMALDCLERLCGSVDDDRLIALLSNAFLTPLAKAAVARPRLRASAVAAMARANPAHAPRDLVEALAALPVQGEMSLTGVLLERLAALDETAAVAWLQESQQAMPSQNWGPTWKRLVLALTDDRLRADALDAWLATR